MLRIRLSDDDRDRYGGPEWLEYDLRRLADEETGDLELIEDRCNIMAGELLNQVQRGGLKATRALIWLARKHAGCRDDWSTFRPFVSRAELKFDEDEPAEGDAVPPANRAGRRAAAKSSGRTRKPSDASGT